MRTTQLRLVNTWVQTERTPTACEVSLANTLVGIYFVNTRAIVQTWTRFAFVYLHVTIGARVSRQAIANVAVRVWNACQCLNTRSRITIVDLRITQHARVSR